MSWQAYVDQQMVGSGFCSTGAIIGLDGSVWATSAGFNVAEGAALARMFSDPSSAFASGITVAGVKYMCIRADPRSIYGKKGATGVVCVKTNQAILIGTYGENIQPGQCTTVVEKVADYLIENNY
eukprot:GABW01000878.1.p1 GENE.GABW01000878.1~~GABW01000878.1.p1  ORF type:complete len:125 (-),score=29.71 GABW01000878.1:63-437(-)